MLLPANPDFNQPSTVFASNAPNVTMFSKDYQDRKIFANDPFAVLDQEGVGEMIRIGIEISGQPHEIAIGPPLFHACPYVVKQPARTEMIVNEIAKFEKPLIPRRSSWA